MSVANTFFGFPGFVTSPPAVTVGGREGDEETMFGVFVGDLPQDANEQDLIKLFTIANFPVVKCKIIRDMDNNSKRYGFVHFPTEEMRQKAIIDMHGVTLKGQTINVRTQHYKETDRCLVKMGTKKTDIYIGNIPRSLTKFQVREAVSDWDLPNVQDIKVFKNDTGMFCFISFLTEAEVSEVMEELKNNPRTLSGRELLVQSSGTSITSTLNAEILRNPNFAASPEEQQIVHAVNLLKLALGGESCPLNDRQLALLEKSQRTLYVRNLHPSTKEGSLNQKFNKYGKLRKVIIVTDKDTKVPMGYGFVEFYSGLACSRAAMEDNCELDGQLLTLQVSRPPKDIHAIITQAGMTDANGNLLAPYTAPVLQAQTTILQDPTTGQLFMGDSQHLNHYVTQGYTIPANHMAGIAGGMIMQQPVMQPMIMPSVNPLLMQTQMNPLMQQQQFAFMIQQQQLALQQQQQQAVFQSNVDTAALQQMQAQLMQQTTQNLPAQLMPATTSPGNVKQEPATARIQATETRPANNAIQATHVPQQIQNQAQILPGQTSLPNTPIQARMQPLQNATSGTMQSPAMQVQQLQMRQMQPQGILSPSNMIYQTPTNQKLLAQAQQRTRRFAPY